MTVKEFKGLTKEQRDDLAGAPKCTGCRCSITDHPDNYIYVDSQVYCDDCYWKGFGDFLEQNPIGGHRR
jgi:hypothetical protein